MGGGESSLRINRKFFFIFRSFLIFVSSLVWLSWFYVHKNPRQYFVISRFYLEIHHNPKTLSPSFRRHFLSPRSPALRDSRGCACRRVHQQTTLYKCIYNPLVLKTCKDLTFCSSSSVKPSEHSSAFIHCWEPSLSRPARDFARPTRATTEYVVRRDPENEAGMLLWVCSSHNLSLNAKYVTFCVRSGQSLETSINNNSPFQDLAGRRTRIRAGNLYLWLTIKTFHLFLFFFFIFHLLRRKQSNKNKERMNDTKQKVRRPQ